MSVSSGFYDSLKGDRKYNIRQLCGILDGVITNGVYLKIGDHFNVTPDSGMNVIVGTGRGWFNESWIVNEPKMPIAIEPSDAILKRIDAIVIDVDQSRNKRKNDIIYVKGTPASQPKRPDMIKDVSKTHYQYPIAYILVKPEAKEITQGDITFVVGTSETPYVSSPLEGFNLDEHIAQWQSQFDVMFAKLEEQIAQTVGQQITDGAVSSKLSAKISPIEWQEQPDGTYINETQVIGLLDSDGPYVTNIIDIDTEKYSNVDDVSEAIDAWSNVYKAKSKSAMLTLTSFSPIEVTLFLKITCIRK